MRTRTPRALVSVYRSTCPSAVEPNGSLGMLAEPPALDGPPWMIPTVAASNATTPIRTMDDLTPRIVPPLPLGGHGRGMAKRASGTFGGGLALGTTTRR